MINIFLALFAGGLNALAFAPFGWWPLSLISFACLFYLWLISTARQAAGYGFCFGLTTFGVGISWTYISLNTYGGMPAPLAALSILVFIAFLALYPMLCGWLQALFCRHNPSRRLAIVMPSLWLLIEWLRGWLLSGFPWLSTGYSYIDTPLANYAALGGVYLVGWLALLSAGGSVALLRRFSFKNCTFALFIAALWAGGWQFTQHTWTHMYQQPFTVAIIQNNVELRDKWDTQSTRSIIDAYLAQSEQHKTADLIVWPEAAIPAYLDTIPRSIWETLAAHPADFILGLLLRDRKEDVYRYFNGVAVVTDQIVVYRKRHLVPFGEYVPTLLASLLEPIMQFLHIPMSNLTAWPDRQPPLMAAHNRFAISICFEDIFPAEWRYQVPTAGVLLNVSEDIWFGDSFAPHQRLQMARFRAKESGRPLIRSGNNGLSALINWRGEVVALAPQFTQHVVLGAVQPRQGLTPYIRFGDNPSLALAAGLLVLCLLFGRAPKRFTSRARRMPRR